MIDKWTQEVEDYDKWPALKMWEAPVRDILIGEAEGLEFYKVLARLAVTPLSGPTGRGEEVSTVADVEKLIKKGNVLFDLLPDPSFVNQSL